MVGTFRAIPFALCALFLSGTSADAFGGRWSGRTICAMACPPAPVRCYLPPPPPPCWVVPVAPTFVAPPPHAVPIPKVGGLASPLPAAPSTSKEPPLRAPTITEARSFGGVMPAQTTDISPGRYKVGFWNITGGDVTLTIDGQARKLPKDRAVTLELERTFVWHIEGRTARTERVPEGQTSFEVILRP